MADDQVKERIRDAVDIVQVVGERVQLKKAGKNHLARCPFHNEKTPSFNVNSERQIYHCFGCGVGGDIFAFVMAYDKVSFPEALRTLAERANIPLDDAASKKHRARQDAQDPLYKANALAREFFVDTLNNENAGRAAREYIESRNLTDDTVNKFGLGYAPDSWDGLLSLARVNKMPQNVLIEAGLAVQGDRGRVYDRFRGRVTFPITNDSGRVVAYGARSLDPDGQPKYLNSSESPVYQKNRILYGLFQARDAIRQDGYVLVVEGYMDVIRLVQEGIENVVATCGTAMTPEHGRVLRRFAERIVLVFDGDSAGERAAVRAGHTLLEAGIEAMVVLLPAGDDPDSLVAAEGADALRQMADEAIPFLRFRWTKAGEEHDLGTVTGRNNAIGDMLDVVAPVEDEIVRTLMAGYVAEWGGVDEALVRRAIDKRRSTRRPRRDPGSKDVAPRKVRWRPPPVEKELVARMLDQPFVCRMLAEAGVESITDDRLREIAERLVDLTDEGLQPTVQNLLEHRLEDLEWQAAVASVSQLSFEQTDEDKAARDLIAAIRLPQLASDIMRLQQRFREDLDRETLDNVSRQLIELKNEQARLSATRDH